MRALSRNFREHKADSIDVVLTAVKRLGSGQQGLVKLRAPGEYEQLEYSLYFVSYVALGGDGNPCNQYLYDD
jgi:hypothetical protein